MKMSRLLMLVVALAGLMLSQSCEWESPKDGDSFNSDVPFDVTGTYRAATPGNPVVVDFSSIGREENPAVEGRQVSTANGTQFKSFTLPNRNITPGTVLITVADISYRDDREGNLVATGTPGAGSTPVGSIAYEGGGVFLDYRREIPSGTPIFATYSYLDRNASRPGSGASRTTIYSFTVQQLGDSLTITDNNGDSYTGKLGKSRITGETADRLNRSIQFRAEGNSRGVDIKIIGVFNTFNEITVADTTVATGSTFIQGQSELGRTLSLTMEGTWVEPRGSGGIEAFAR
jgi:hypothetical protein